MSKGSQCSVNGKNYEILVHGILSRCCSADESFNVSLELGGCSAKNDVECQYNGASVGIELKTEPVDCMQCVLKHTEANTWQVSDRKKIPVGSAKIFETLIPEGGLTLFNGTVPPFVEKDILYNDWVQFKKENGHLRDSYLECPSDTINRLYREKGCYYIQLLGKGLYHTGEDICQWGVPEFVCQQQLRIRIKVHGKENKKGYANLSVTLSCQPAKGWKKNMAKSPYSLDSVASLPPTLRYRESQSPTTPCSYSSHSSNALLESDNLGTECV